MNSNPVEEAETSVLGSLLLTGGKDLDDIRLSESDFLSPKNASIFSAIKHLVSDALPVDPISVSDVAAKNGSFKLGPADLHYMMQATPSPASVGYYAEIVRDAAALRGLRNINLKALERADALNDPYSVAQEEVLGLDKLLDHGSREVQDFASSLDNTIENLHEVDNAIPTPWPSLNDVIGGWRPGQVSIIAARPGVGKTAIAVQAARHALKYGHVAFSSLEMSKDELHLRIISQMLGVDYGSLVRRKISAKDWHVITSNMESLRSMNLWIDDNPSTGIGELRSFARWVSKKGQMAALFLDYIQLMSQPKGDQRPRHQFISDISREIKILAKQMKLPVIMLAQLNRSSESLIDRKPQLHHLKDSGSLEQDASVVALLHRELNDENKKHVLNVNVAKNRFGRTGSLNLDFIGHLSQVRDRA